MERLPEVGLRGGISVPLQAQIGTAAECGGHHRGIRTGTREFLDQVLEDGFRPTSVAEVDARRVQFGLGFAKEEQRLLEVISVGAPLVHCRGESGLQFCGLELPETQAALCLMEERVQVIVKQFASDLFIPPGALRVEHGFECGAQSGADPGCVMPPPGHNAENGVIVLPSRVVYGLARRLCGEFREQAFGQLEPRSEASGVRL
jgi:hypothetical protein